MNDAISSKKVGEKALLEEKNRIEAALEKPVLGFRNHFLRFTVPDTWKILSEAGFKYDSTLGFADMVGFRNGMCHPFNPVEYNLKTEFDILEIPLAVMDCTLFDYMRLDLNGAWEITKKLIDTTDKYSGVLTLNWHNRYMNGEKLRLYEKILKYCYEKNAWLASAEEVYGWWQKQSLGKVI